jgi:hypothetical protein
MLAFIALSFWLIRLGPGGVGDTMVLISITSALSVWITLTFFVQLSAFQNVFFRPEALQYRLARLRNRSLVISAALIHSTILAVFASLPYAVLFVGMVDEPRIVMLSLANILLFHVFLGVATALIIRLIGVGTSTTLILLLILFVLPLSLSGLFALSPGLEANPVVVVASDWLRAHLEVFSNSDMLLLRGIQDTDAIVRALILTPILATITYVLFLRGDHH